MSDPRHADRPAGERGRGISDQDKRAEAAAYFGHGMPPGGVGPALIDLWPERVIEAVTSDDLGTVPPELAASAGWAKASERDREEIMRFVALLRAGGKPTPVS